MLSDAKKFWDALLLVINNLLNSYCCDLITIVVNFLLTICSIFDITFKILERFSC